MSDILVNIGSGNNFNNADLLSIWPKSIDIWIKMGTFCSDLSTLFNIGTDRALPIRSRVSDTSSLHIMQKDISFQDLWTLLKILFSFIINIIVCKTLNITKAEQIKAKECAYKNIERHTAHIIVSWPNP